MGVRQGEFIGCYAPAKLKEDLQKRARSEHRTLSQEVIRILTEAVYGRPIAFDEVDGVGDKKEK